MRHDNVAKVFPCQLCEKWGFNKTNGTCINQIKTVESENCKSLRDFPVQTDNNLAYSRPDITVIKMKKKSHLIDPALSFNT